MTLLRTQTFACHPLKLDKYVEEWAKKTDVKESDIVDIRLAATDNNVVFVIVYRKS